MSLLAHAGLLLKALGGSGGLSARYWRINITANDGSTSYFGLTELELIETVGGSDATVAAEAGTRASASSQINGPNAAALAFDDSTGAGWLSATATTSWLQWDFGAGNSKTIRQITIRGSYNVPTASPKDFTLDGSADGTSWTTVLTVTGETGWTGSSDKRTFNVP